MYNHSRSWCKHNDNGAQRWRAPHVCAACAGTITCLFSKICSKNRSHAAPERTRDGMHARSLSAVRAAQPTLQLCMFYSILTRTQQGRMAFQLHWATRNPAQTSRRRVQFVLVIILRMVVLKSASDIFLAATCPARRATHTQVIMQQK